MGLLRDAIFMHETTWNVQDLRVQNVMAFFAPNIYWNGFKPFLSMPMVINEQYEEIGENAVVRSRSIITSKDGL
jgi:hypothetical protein